MRDFYRISGIRIFQYRLRSFKDEKNRYLFYKKIDFIIKIDIKNRLLLDL